MSWGYSTAPQNLSEQDVRRLARQEAINSIQSQSITGSMVPRSIPQITVDIPIRTDLPKAPEDGQEVYLRVGDDAVAHMLYLASLPGWVQTGMAPVVTTLPTDPVDGMRVDYVADSTNGVVWSLRYRAAGSATYPWEFVGGSSLFEEAQAGGVFESTASGSYAALATAGPTVTAPLAGDYDVTFGARAFNDTNGGSGAMSFDIGGTAASDDNAVIFSEASGSNTTPANYMRSDRVTVAAAATALTSKYKRITAGNATFTARWMRVTPVRVGA